MVATLAVAALACLNTWAVLPSDYQEVEWIESTGTQYINTGVVPGAMFGVTARLNTGTYKHESAFFGTAWDTYRYLFRQQSNNFYFHGNSTTICGVQSGTDCTVTIEPTTGDNGTFTFAPDGGTPVSKTVSLKNNASTTSLRIFGTGAANRFSSFRLYSFKLYKRETTEGDEGTVTTDVPQLDLVPCEEKATGIYGLYDLVKETFLTNAGTGVFVAGPHVFSSNTLEVRTRDNAAGMVDTSVNGTYADGAVVTITATPAAGKRFFRWVGDIEKVADELSPETTVTMNGGADLTALFGGEITVAPTGGDYDNLNDAVANAKDYDTIIVKDGTYINKTAAFLAITKPIAIVSENGKEHAFFRSEKSPSGGKININPAYKGMQVNHEFAVVRGLTFFNFGCDAAQNPQGLGVYLNAGLVEDCVISNTLPNHGASALHVTGGTARRMLITKNNSNNTSKGAGAYLTGGSLLDSVICGNSDGVDGGGVYVNGANAVVRSCQIFGNSTSGSGGGVGLVSGLVENCVITNNSGNAGGVYQTGGTLRDCLVKGNKSGYLQKYGGVQSTGGVIEDCDIIGNSAYYPEGKQLYKTVGTVTGTTVAEGLHVVPCSDVVKVADSVTVQNCVFQAPGIAGATELNASDYFAADEFHVHADKVVGLAPLTVNFAAAGTAATPSWNFGDETTSSEATPSHKFENAGRYTVMLTAGGETTTLDILALPAKTYVGKNGSATFPYDTEEKATADFQAAHDAVYADDTVHGTVEVLADTYTYGGANVSSTFVPWMLVNKNVTVQGATGNRDDVVFDAKQYIMTMFLFHPKAVLKDLTISNGRLNQSSQYGATLHMMDGFVTNCVISKGNCNFGGNASIRGGSIWNSAFLDGTLSQSGEDRPGGGLQIRGASMVANCIFDGNTGGLGGGFSIHDSGAVVSNCVIRNNKGGRCCGAGVGVLAGLVTHCVITNNTSDYGAGGARVSGGTLRNCLVANNRANGTGTMGVGPSKCGGGGITVSSGTAENCTVAYNTSASPTRSDELYQTGGTVRNCVFVGKDGTASFDVCKTGGTATYCCFREDVAVTGEGNKSEDVKMAAPADGDYTLLYGSPAIDAGMTIAAVATDLLGVPRPVNDVYDMGCYEMDFSGKMGVTFDADITSGGTATEVTLTAEVEGGTEPYTYIWTIGGQTYETDSDVFKHTFGYGEHDVTLVVKDANGAESDPVARKGLVKIKSAVVYVSTTGSGVWPYDTWEKATADWNAAVGAVYATEAVPGKIWIADGTYTAHDSDIFTADLTLPIELCGTNPACAAVFDGKKTYHKVVKLNHAKSVLANVTIKDCNGGSSSDCACLWLYSGLATNCVFAGGSDNGAGNVWQSGGTMADCVVRDHDAGTHAGGDRMGGGLYLSGGTAERLVISGCTDGQGGGVFVDGSDAVLRDSVIRGNLTGVGGAVMLRAGLVENCIITNNTGNGATGSIVDGVRIGGGGVSLIGANGVLRNCLVSGNACGNSSEENAAFYVRAGTAYNNTVWLNTMKNGVTNDVYVASGTLANTLAYTVTNVAGTISHCFVAATDGDPKFKDAANGDFHIRSSSPAKDAGDKSYWDGVADPVDLDGLPRIRFGKIDVGCYENQVAGFMLYLR